MDWVNKGKGLRNTNHWLQNSHGDVKHSGGNIIDNCNNSVGGEVGTAATRGRGHCVRT